MQNPIYRTPPYFVNELYSSASDLGEQIDWSQDAVGLPEAWLKTAGETKDGFRVPIAILDTGIDRKHNESGDLQNFAADDIDSAVPRRDGYARRGDHHGTHCCGIIAATADDQGVRGAAYKCRPISIKCMDGGSGSSDWIGRALDMAKERGALVASMSLGSSGPSSQISEAIKRFTAAGGFVVCAAGNSGRRNDVSYPAAWDGGRSPALDTIAVAATQADGSPAPYSSAGPQVDIAAPGSQILSTWENGGYAKLSGTSMATPMVAAVVGLLIARHMDAENPTTPMETTEQVREHLKRGSTDMLGPGHDDKTGWGLIDASKLVDDEDAAPVEPPTDSPGSDKPIIEWGPVKIYMPARSQDFVSVSATLDF